MNFDATDRIFKSWPFRFVSNNFFAAFSQVFSLSLLWLLVRFLPLVILTFFLSAPQAKAALQDGAATTVDGTTLYDLTSKG